MRCRPAPTEDDTDAPPFAPPPLSERPDRPSVVRHRVDDPRRDPRRSTAQGRQTRDRRGDPPPAAGPAARGVCCRTIPRRGRPSTTISAAGSGRACGPGSTTRRFRPTASEKAATPRRRPPSSTAGPSGRRNKRAIQGLRRQREDPWAQAPHHDRHRLPAVEVHAADVQDRDGAKGVPRLARRAFPFVETVFADGGYDGRLADWAQTKTHVALEIVKRPRGATGFVVIRRRWVVERTFASIMKGRRLVRDYEQLTAVAEALITVAAIATLVRRLA